MTNISDEHNVAAGSLKVLIPVLKEASSWGADDPRISRPYILAKEMTKHLDLDEAILDEVDFLADRLLDKLEAALMHYQLITSEDFNTRNISQKRLIYEGLYASLWSFYKGRVQNYLKAMGWDISIFFCKEINFEKEAKKFTKACPEHIAVIDLARKQRKAWQSDFAKSRNTSEHSGDYRDGTNTYENPNDAKRLFAKVCWLAETLVAYFGSYKMKPEWNVVETNPGSSVFDDKERHVVEHAIQTTQREQHSG